VHLAEFPAVTDLLDRDLVARWDRLRAVREQVNAALEDQRKQKVIGNSLGAHVTVRARGPVAALLAAHRGDLPTLFIVSELALDTGAPDGPDVVEVEVARAPGVKCERCWRYVPATRTEPEWAGLCERCVEALAEPVNG
jgi:isoleucyl-tRNA synthetase